MLNISPAELDAEVTRLHSVWMMQRETLGRALAPSLRDLFDEACHTYGEYLEARRLQEDGAVAGGSSRRRGAVWSVETQRLRAQLEAQLSPAQVKLLGELAWAIREGERALVEAENERMMEAMALHFGPLAGVVRALALHVENAEHIYPDNCDQAWPWVGQRMLGG